MHLEVWPLFTLVLPSVDSCPLLVCCLSSVCVFCLVRPYVPPGGSFVCLFVCFLCLEYTLLAIILSAAPSTATLYTRRLNVDSENRSTLRGRCHSRATPDSHLAPPPAPAQAGPTDRPSRLAAVRSLLRYPMVREHTPWRHVIESWKIIMACFPHRSFSVLFGQLSTPMASSLSLQRLLNATWEDHAIAGRNSVNVSHRMCPLPS